MPSVLWHIDLASGRASGLSDDVPVFCSYPSGAKCKWFAYCPFDVTATLPSRFIKIENDLPFYCW